MADRDRVAITVELDRSDFDALTTTSMAWHGIGWHDQPDRFRPFKGGDPIDWGMRWAYWFNDAASMILARSFLDGLGEPHQVLRDEACDGPAYLIITGYTAPDMDG